jgi:opacity protein-like surface antigen
VQHDWLKGGEMNIPCRLLTVLTLALGSTSAYGQDAYSSDSYAIGSPFEGVYAGVYTGGRFNPGTSITLGAIGGANFTVTDNITVGIEGQGGAAFSNPTNFDALMVGHLGYEVDDQVMIYGALGAGVVNSSAAYAVGVGAEAMVLQDIGVRGEILGTGPWGGGLNGAKASAGVIWHMR